MMKYLIRILSTSLFLLIAQGQGEVVNTSEEIPEIFQFTSEAIQKNLRDKLPMSMGDVTDAIKKTIIERCSVEDIDCPDKAKALVTFNEKKFHELTSVSRLMGPGSTDKMILLMEDKSVQAAAGIDMKSILSLIQNFSGNVRQLLSGLINMGYYVSEINYTFSVLTNMAPNRNSLILGTLAVVVESIKWWFGPDKKSIEYSNADVTKILQHTIFGYVSSGGDARAAVTFTALSYESIYGGFDEAQR